MTDLENTSQWKSEAEDDLAWLQIHLRSTVELLDEFIHGEVHFIGHVEYGIYGRAAACVDRIQYRRMRELFNHALDDRRDREVERSERKVKVGRELKLLKGATDA